MMTKLIYAIGDGFEAFFKILPTLGPIVDAFIIITGALATIGWIGYMLKNREKSA